MANAIIEARPTERRSISDAMFNSGMFLDIAEFYCDTIQGEGQTIGRPASFLRLQNCTLNCKWCDTKEVWRYGNPYSFDEIIVAIQLAGLPEKFINGQHLIITGGSPLMQQDALIKLLDVMETQYDIMPIIEIENECTIMPEEELVQNVEFWNNSPKLNNSRNGRYQRYKPEIIEYMAGLSNSTFKFVVYDESDWQEIYDDFLGNGLISPSQVILMPRGETIEVLDSNREFAVNMAIEHGVRYCTREHVVLWNTATGV